MWFRKDKGVDEAKEHHEKIRKKSEEYRKREQRARALRNEVKELERRIQGFEEKRKRSEGAQSTKFEKMAFHLGMLKRKKEEELRHLAHSH